MLVCLAVAAHARFGRPQGSKGIVAPGWQSVTGTLSPDGSQIDWTNGTYWLRCGTHSEAVAHRPLNLTGTWYADSIRSQPCSIRQSGKNLQLNNGQSGNGTGQVDSAGHLTTDWNGNRIEGKVTADGNHINWDNQTYWTQSKVYELQGK